MAFIARLDKPCTHCGVVIPKGTSGTFTWDRAKGGFIHLDCMKVRKQAGHQPATPSPLPGVVITDVTPAGYGPTETPAAIQLPPETKMYSCPYPDCGVTSPDMEQLRLHSLDKHAVKEVKKAEVSIGVTNGAANQLAALIQSLAGARGIDEDAVRRIAADEAAKVSSNRSVKITVGEAPEIKLDLAHRDLPLLIKLVSAFGANGHRQNLYMYGPAGSGKSTAARQASEVLKLPYGYISLNPQTPDSRLLGYMHAGGEYVKSEFFTRYTEGGVFCIDEIDNAAASLVTTLNGLLENGHGAFPHGVYARHKDFVCVCTANTIGRGGDVNYPERRPLDGAFLERFIFLRWEYDTDLTKAIVSGILGTDAPEFIAWVNSEARTLQARYPTLIVSPRAFIQGATLDRIGMSRNQIVNMVIARGLK